MPECLRCVANIQKRIMGMVLLIHFDRQYNKEQKRYSHMANDIVTKSLWLNFTKLSKSL